MQALPRPPTRLPTRQWAILWLTPACPLGVIASEAKQPRATRAVAAAPGLLRRPSASAMTVPTRPGMNEAILREIAAFCRRPGVAESTFGRRAVNDGKLASRLRNGGRITTDTLDRIRAFMAQAAGEPPGRRRILIESPPN